MRNSQRYRLKVAECLAAAKLCQGDHRGLLVSIAVFWQWLARQDEAVEKVLVSWEVGEPDRQTGQVLAFRPISPAGGSIRRRDTLLSRRRQRDQVGAQLVVLANVALATTGGLSPGQITPGEGLVEGNGMRARFCGRAMNLTSAANPNIAIWCQAPARADTVAVPVAIPEATSASTDKTASAVAAHVHRAAATAATHVRRTDPDRRSPYVRRRHAYADRVVAPNDNGSARN
jgi:hypothetical protein